MMIALVRQLRLEADRVMSVRLTDPDGRPLPPWRPGAHVGIELPTGLTRQYSLCGSPADRDGYRIGVLRERRSRGGSEYVHSFLRPGQRLRITEPRNNFPLVAADRYLFIAGGIGITPILPMIEQVGARPWRLAYCGRSVDSLAFLDELTTHSGHVDVFADGNRLALTALLAEPRPGTAVYACGPESLLAGVEEAMTGWPTGSLHLERFAARPKPVLPNHEFEVVCARSGRTVTVPVDRSTLDVLQDNGIPVEGSCREGVCGTCQVRVLDGTPDHRDDILSDAERVAGDRMFVCVSRCAGSRLVLDV
ncbi:PDR/VanB family oxidoreductase [Nocardia sp. NPDC051570]|uniref:PDR/VanB family oxidoreductase n=1 Tax=Nocardia sp. NPDC051570 TaxID=3364324 RepID=UPI0037AF7968